VGVSAAADAAAAVASHHSVFISQHRFGQTSQQPL